MKLHNNFLTIGSFAIRLWRKIDTRKLKSDVQASGFFDEAWYLATYPDVKQNDWDALNHFCRHGIRELRSPGPFFAPRYYLRSNLDVKQAGIPPFIHFMMAGRMEGRSPHPLFDVDYYREQAADTLDADADALAHYRDGGWKLGLRPNRWFDDTTYLALNPTAKDAPYPPLEHYLWNGREAGVNLMPYFAQDYYCEQNSGALCNWNYTPLHHYVEHGVPGGKLAKPPGVWKSVADNQEILEKNKADILQLCSSKPDQPTVLVVVPVYNQFAYTVQCVASILNAGDKTSIEIIIADDLSTDETEAFFRDLKGLRYIRNPENLGFVRSCNNAAAQADAPYILFLNNDTRVTSGWVDQLVETFEHKGDAGVVGSKLIYPDETLQESGCFIWRDGTGANIGRCGNESHPAYNFLRPVDYVSGAALMIKRSLWDELGGFDERYVPAYCEDADICLAAQSAGYKVYIQPQSVVVHFEGISSGKSTSSGTKASQITNQQKLAEKWSKLLQGYPESHPLTPWHSSRDIRPSLLMIDGFVPSPDRDAGSLVAYHYIKIFIKLGYRVTFLPDDLRLFHKYGRDLQALGVEIIHSPHVENGFNYIEEIGEKFDVFLLNKVHAGGKYFKQIKKLFPDKPVLFNTADLHFVREQREAVLKGSEPQALARAARTKKNELNLIRKADQTIIVSSEELEILKREGITKKLSLIPLVMSSRAPNVAFEQRRGIGFIGGYQHTPNVDAVLSFVEEIWPHIHKAIPDLTFHVAGSNAPDAIRNLAVPGVIYEGFVQDLDQFFDGLTASIAPLRFGAGIKGKIGSSLAAGLPCIASPVAFEGMGLVENESIIVAKTADQYIEAIKRLNMSEQEWSKISAKGIEFVDQNYSPEIILESMMQMLNNILKS